MSDKKSKKPEGDGPPPDEPKPKKPLPMVSIPDDSDVMAEEMAELFDEDRVTHQHGSSEPEAD